MLNPWHVLSIFPWERTVLFYPQLSQKQKNYHTKYFNLVFRVRHAIHIAIIQINVFFAESVCSVQLVVHLRFGGLYCISLKHYIDECLPRRLRILLGITTMRHGCVCLILSYISLRLLPVDRQAYVCMLQNKDCHFLLTVQDLWEAHSSWATKELFILQAFHCANVVCDDSILSMITCSSSRTRHWCFATFRRVESLREPITVVAQLWHIRR